MAVTAKNYFSNAIVGVPQVGADVNIYKEDTSPSFALGTKFERQDGAIFRYSHFGATVASAGLLCSVDISESSESEVTSAIVASASTYQVDGETVGVYPNMLGSKFIVATLGSITTDEFAGGYVVITSGPSATSETYRIKGNTATGNPDSGNFRIELYARLQAGLNSSTTFTVTGNRYANLEASLAATGSDLASGVTLISITTAGDYGWVQTKGIIGVLCGSTTILAQRMVGISTSVAGAIDLAIATSSITISTIVGISCANSTAATFVPIALQLD